MEKKFNYYLESLKEIEALNGKRLYRIALMHLGDLVATDESGGYKRRVRRAIDKSEQI